MITTKVTKLSRIEIELITKKFRIKKSDSV